jgi:hypothetical protein
MRKNTATKRKPYTAPALTVNTDAAGDIVVEQVTQAITQASAEPSHFWVKSSLGFPTMLYCPCGASIALGSRIAVRRFTQEHQDCRLLAPTEETSEL